MKKITLSSEIILQIIKQYQSGLSLAKVGKQFFVSGEYIRELLHKNNIHVRKYSEINRKHKVNEDYFSAIDTEEKAYFLGLLFSDGNVHAKYNSVVLKLQEKDKDILIKLSHIIMDKELLYKSEDNYVLKFSSYKIKQDLINLGCMPNKTFKLQFPQIDEKLYHHFIRGYFDGDGSIIRYKNDFCISLISTENFCQAVNFIIFDQLSISGKMNKDKEMLARGNDITSILLYQGNRRIQKILDWLYKDAIIYLERKYQRYLELKLWIENVDRRMPNRINMHKAL